MLLFQAMTCVRGSSLHKLYANVHASADCTAVPTTGIFDQSDERRCGCRDFRKQQANQSHISATSYSPLLCSKELTWVFCNVGVARKML